MEETNSSNKKVQIYTEIIGRALLQAKLGRDSYSGARNIYTALGYPADLLYADYASRYLRQDIAKAIIDRPAKATWQGNLAIVETHDDKETALEKAWKDLSKQLKLKTRFQRVDRLAGIGRYGILLLGTSDVKNRAAFATQLTKGSKLLYVKPLGESSAEISEFETRTNNPRYGLPLLYKVSMSDSTNGNKFDVQVHHSRVIHIVDDVLESESEGRPRLEAVYNRLIDLEKIVGGDAEMFWRGARPGYTGNVSADYQMPDNVKEDLLNQVDEYEHDLRRFLINEGVDLKALEQQISDPINHVDVQIQMIAAVTRIPKRILVGSERGELSSAQDKGEWLAYVKSRREEFADPNVVQPFVDRCIEYGILPKPADEYTIEWEDLFSLSEKEKAEIGKSRANSLREYSTNPMAEYIVPPSAFLKFFLGLSEGDVELITKLRKTEEMIEMPVTGEEEATIAQETATVAKKPVNANTK